MDFIEALEKCLGLKSQKNYMPIQAGDIPATWADANLLKELTGFSPNTEPFVGIQKFVEWYRAYYNI